jgi:selenide,water dikinase
MAGLEIPYQSDVLVGLDTSDDAGIIQISEDLALVQTVDFITPVVDDPYTYGRIAACNSLSDIYAMGASPISALNIVGFPTDTFSMDKLQAILKGGLSVLNETNTRLLGGHSVDDPEMKYGMAVTGLINPKKIIRNIGLVPGTSIILTKPIGTGVISTALKADIIEKEHLVEFTKTMASLNNIIPILMEKYSIYACTDVTGFGLMGHLKEMLGDENLSFDISSSNIPILPGAISYAETGLIPAGLYRNREHVGDTANINDNVSQAISDLVFDPQTSGGLLIALPEDESQKIVADIKKMGFLQSSIIGTVKKSNKPLLNLL